MMKAFLDQSDLIHFAAGFILIAHFTFFWRVTRLKSNSALWKLGSVLGGAVGLLHWAMVGEYIFSGKDHIGQIRDICIVVFSICGGIAALVWAARSQPGKPRWKIIQFYSFPFLVMGSATVLLHFLVPDQMLAEALISSLVIVLFSANILAYGYVKRHEPLNFDSWRVAGLIVLLMLIGFGVTTSIGSIGTDLQLRDDEKEVFFIENQLVERTDQLHLVGQSAVQSPSLDVFRDGVLDSADLPPINEWLDRMAALVPGSYAFIASMDGKVVASSNRNTRASLVGHNLQGRAHFVRASRGEVALDFVIQAGSETAIAVWSTPIRDHRGFVRGVFGSGLPFSYMNMFLLASAKAFLITPQGLVLYSNIPGAAQRPLCPVTVEAVQGTQALSQLPNFDPSPVFNECPRNMEKISLGGEALRILKRPTIQNFSFVFLFAPRLDKYFRGAAMLVMLLVSFIVMRQYLAYWDERKARLILAASEERYRSIFENESIVMLITDPVRMKLIDANPAAARFYGYTREQIQSMSISDLHVGSPQEIADAVNAPLGAPLQMQHRLASGEIRDVSLSRVRIKTAAGQTVTVSVVTDMTERNRAELERERIMKQLVEAEKLASIGTLAAGVAHEINNPLMIAKGFVSNLVAEIQADSPVPVLTGIVEKIDKAIDRIAVIVLGLRTFARRDTGKLEPINLSELARESMALIEPMYRMQNISIKLQTDPALPYVLANPGQFQQILSNLMSNARDALENKAEDRMIVVRTFREGDLCCLSVADNGAGMDPQTLSRIFDPFFTTKEPGKGTGLGLSITRSLVQAFGGVITARSEPGQGTTVRIAFPAALGENEVLPSSRNRNVAPAAIPRLSGRVLIVDDEEDLRNLLGAMTNELGLSTVMASGGQEALDLLQAEHFDFVLLDLQMPGIGGKEVLERAKKFPAAKGTCFVTITGALTESRIDCDGFLRKPFGMADLVVVLQKAKAARA